MLSIIFISFIFMLFFADILGPSDEELRLRGRTAIIASSIRAYAKEHNEYPESLKNLFDDISFDDILKSYPIMKGVHIREVKTFDGSGGWVYSLENKYIQVNDNKYKDIIAYFNEEGVGVHEIQTPQTDAGKAPDDKVK